MTALDTETAVRLCEAAGLRWQRVGLTRKDILLAAIKIRSYLGPPRLGEDASERFARFLQSGYAPSVLAIPDQQLTSLLYYKLCHHGLRDILIGHKMAAALMSTTIHASVLEDIRPPWSTFMLEIPDGLLHLSSPNGPTPITNAVVDYEAGLWSYVIHTTSTTGTWGNGLPARTLIEAQAPSGIALDYPRLYPPLDALDERSMCLFWRLLFGVCMLMTDPKNVRSPHTPKRTGRSRQSKEPTVRVYTITAKPSYDCRPHVAAYLNGERGTGKPLSVQFIVGGHWKQQPCGPQHSLRKTIWIEPYWRGPDDAPILVKPTRIREREGDEPRERGVDKPGTTVAEPAT